MPVYLCSLAMIFLLIINYISIAGSSFPPTDYNSYSMEFPYMMGTELINETLIIDTMVDLYLEDIETFTLLLTSTGLNGSRNSIALRIQDGNGELLVLFDYYKQFMIYLVLK